MALRKPRKKAKAAVKGTPKFEKRTQKVLKQIYDTREARSSSRGKSIFKTDGLPEWLPTSSESGHVNEVFIGPAGFRAESGYTLIIPVHYRVGAMRDAFVCLQRLLKQKCPICEAQGKLLATWREENPDRGTKLPTNIIELFPTDRPVYFLLDMEDDEKQDEGWQLWAAPHRDIHQEVVSRSHNKRQGTFADLSDFEDGRIVSFECARGKGDTWPQYRNVSLEELEEPISEEAQEALAEIIEEAEDIEVPKIAELQTGRAIFQFLHIPTYEEVAQAFSSTFTGGKVMAASGVADATPEDAEEVIRDELSGMNKFQLKKYAKKHGIIVSLKGKEEEDIIDEIINAMEAPAKPACFGEAYDHEACTECRWLDDGCVEASE